MKDSRRSFLAGTAAACATLALKALADQNALPRHAPILFTKPFQSVGFQKTAEVVAECGWKGIECPIRKKGQIEPERAADEMPRLHEALKSKNLSLVIATTDIINTSTPFAEKILRTAKQVGCTRYRIGIQNYDLDKPIPPQLANVKAAYRDLAAMNKEIGICGGMQNHNGAQRMGCAVWDIYELVHELDPKYLGICFDIAHATVEGGNAWPVHARLMEPYFSAAYVKDFQWKKGEKGHTVAWCPLGEGMVRREYFEWLKKSSYDGPVSQHVEYLEGAGPEQIATMTKDRETLSKWLGQA